MEERGYYSNGGKIGERGSLRQGGVSAGVAHGYDFTSPMTFCRRQGHLERNAG